MNDCRLCIIIRFFLVCVLMIIITGLLMTDQLHYLNFVNPWNAVKLIFFLGICLFFFKLIDYLKTKD